MQNYYDILGVSTNATEKEIRTSYIEKIKKYHPDTFDGDKSFAEKQTALITEAYTTLKDTTLRMRYDLRNNISVSSNSSKQTKKPQPQKPKENAQKKTEKPQAKPKKEQKENTKQNNKKDKKQQKKEEKPVKNDKNDVKKPKYTKKQLIEDIFIVLLAGLLIFILVLAIF